MSVILGMDQRFPGHNVKDWQTGEITGRIFKAEPKC